MCRKFGDCWLEYMDLIDLMDCPSNMEILLNNKKLTYDLINHLMINFFLMNGRLLHYTYNRGWLIFKIICVFLLMTLYYLNTYYVYILAFVKKSLKLYTYFTTMNLYIGGGFHNTLWTHVIIGFNERCIPPCQWQWYYF